MSAPYSLEEALLRHVSVMDGCHVWSGPLSSDGRPVWRHKRVQKLLVAASGSVTTSCEVNTCVNPAHIVATGRKSGGNHWSSEEARFRARISVGDLFRNLGPCWNWDVVAPATGYGTICVAGRNALAHRWSYEFHVGPIPDGLQVDHLCRNRACVNPDHLEAVTPLVNTVRGAVARAGRDWLAEDVSA